MLQEFCVDVSTYEPVVWVEEEQEVCETMFVKECEEKEQEVCADVSETRCKVGQEDVKRAGQGGGEGPGGGTVGQDPQIIPLHCTVCFICLSVDMLC